MLGYAEPAADWSFWFRLAVAVCFIGVVVWGVYFRFFRTHNRKEFAPEIVGGKLKMYNYE